MVWVKRLFKGFSFLIGAILLLLLLFIVYVSQQDSFDPPVGWEKHVDSNQERKVINDSTFTLGNNWLTKNEFGHYVMYTEGDAWTRGIANGKLSKELIVAQEVAFTDQIRKMIPSDKYLKFLKYVIGFMNRGLPEHVTDEYKQEIFGIAQASSDSFDWIGDKFSRQMNYHAAHDIGHALQNMMLVGCTSFGVWNERTTDSQMLIGRNFDFWVGDKFSENKIISIVRPQDGYPFAFVTWGAFIGVSSGMNSQGLTVTINAAKSDIPFNAATPVSLVAREILQYAKNIDEAKAIAAKRTMFVSESFLVASAQDKDAVVIEKTPQHQAAFQSSSSKIFCANHFQSDDLINEANNQVQIKNSASVYRQQRLLQLVNDSVVFTPTQIAQVLRDKYGLNGTNIGLGNEKAINQLVAHHSVIFQPQQLLMWVSTSPWQEGTYVCYDLKNIFETAQPWNKSIIAYDKNIAANDSFLQTSNYLDFVQFRNIKNEFTFNKKYQFDPSLLIQLNPKYYDAYRLAGDYYAANGAIDKAIEAYEAALKLEIATQSERNAIIEKIKKLQEK